MGGRLPRAPLLLGVCTILAVLPCGNLASLEIQDGGQPNSEPMVAMLCDQTGIQYHNKFLSPDGTWLTDTNPRSTCRKEKVEVLEYCRKAYPDRDITNIVESGHTISLDGWCRVGDSTDFSRCSSSAAAGAKTEAHWVKPFRCLEGQFQSDALLVPEHCLFDHVHNETRCRNFDAWNATASTACEVRNMRVKSIGMLLPCGVDVFSGVEFVCCPHGIQAEEEEEEEVANVARDAGAVASPNAFRPEGEMEPGLKVNSEEDYYVDEEDTYYEMEEDEDYDKEEYDDEDGQLLPSTSTAQPLPTQPDVFAVPTEDYSRDSYFSHYDPKREHAEFVDAERRFDEEHKEKISRVMRDWSVLQEKYQEMKEKDPGTADNLKEKMGSRLENSIQEIEEQHEAQKRQLLATHQQRVLARLNERKKEAMTCYTEGLEKVPQNIHRIKKCLMTLLKSLHKDRRHTIEHFRQLVQLDIEEARAVRTVTLDHLEEVDHSINQSLSLLTKYPLLNKKVLQVMEDYLSALRTRDDTPAPLLLMDRREEEEMVEEMIQRKMEEEREEEREKERKREEEERAELAKKEKEEEEEEANRMAEFTTQPQEDEEEGDVAVREAEIKVEVHASAVHHDEPVFPSQAGPESDSEKKDYGPYLPGLTNVLDLDRMVQMEEMPTVSHAQAHVISHAASYTMRDDTVDFNTVYLLTLLGVGLMVIVVIGVAFRRRRDFHSHDGFIQVETSANPEEKALAGMQMNGYENPTYQFFENPSV